MLRPLSSAAGYNHFEVAEYLLENGADVNAQDKGGLIPLHNASSYGVSLLLLCCFMLGPLPLKVMSVFEELRPRTYNQN